MTKIPPAIARFHEHFIVKFYGGDTHPTIKGNGFDGLVVGEDREEAEAFINAINALRDAAVILARGDK